MTVRSRLLACLFAAAVFASTPTLRASYTFNGGDIITVGTSAIPTTGSLSLWVYSSNTLASGAHIFADVRDAGNNNMWTLEIYNGDWAAGWYTGGAEHRIICGSDLPSTATWTNLILTWDDTANETKLYKGGSQICSTSSTLTTWTTSSETVHLGNDRFGDNSGHDFKLAHVALYSAVISGGTITGLQTCDPSNYTTNQTHRWPLLVDADDDVGTDHGTLVDSPTLNSGDEPTLACGGGGPTGGTGRFLLGGLGR